MKSNLLSARGRKTLLGVATLAAIAITVFGLSRVSSTQEKPRKLPPIVSQVKGVEVTEARIIERDDDRADIELTLRNKSDKPIVAVTVESGEDTEATAQSRHWPDETALQPGDTTTLDIPYGNLIPGHPLRISAVVYADDTAEGTKLATKSALKNREERKKRKEGEQK